MKRYYSHYTYIYPDTYLKNHIVEMDENRIVRVFPFEKEVEKTEFYSGLLVFVPEDKADMSKDILLQIKESDFISNGNFQPVSYSSYLVILYNNIL